MKSCWHRMKYFYYSIYNQNLVRFLIMPMLMWSTTSLTDKLTYISKVYHLQIPQFSLSMYQVQIVKHCNKCFARTNNSEEKKPKTLLQKSTGGRHAPLLYVSESHHYSLLKIPSVFLHIFVIRYFEGQCKLLTVAPRTFYKDLYPCPYNVIETPA